MGHVWRFLHARDRQLRRPVEEPDAPAEQDRGDVDVQLVEQPGRERLLRQVATGEPVPYAPPLYTNRIHRDDCVGVLELLHRRALQGTALGPVYLASDDCPAPLGTVARGLARALGVPPPPPLTGDRGQNKRCRNDRIRALGYRFRFPDWRSGYLPLIAAWRTPAADAPIGPAAPTTS